MSKRGVEDFFQKITLGQQVSADDPVFKDYAGSDVETAKKLAFFNVLLKHGIIKPTKTLTILIDLLKEKQKAVFASAPDTDVLTKLSLRKPQKRGGYNLAGSNDQETTP